MNPEDEVVVGVEVDTALADMGVDIGRNWHFTWQKWAP